MIIKFRADDSWQLYDEVDELHYRNKKENEVFDNSVLDFTRNDRSGYQVGECPAQPFVIGFMNKNQTEECVIVALSPIYIMNNNGRTIETI